MPEVRCPSCEIYAYDNAAPLFGSAHLMVSDDGCSYFVAGREYILKCEYFEGAATVSCPSRIILAQD